MLERNPNYSGEAPAMARAIYRHIPEPATERLLLEQGDIDIARKLGPDEIDALSQNPDIVVESGVKGSIYYFGLNQKNENLAKPEVRAGDQVPGRLPGDRRHHPQGHGRGPPGVPADRLARRARGQPVLARRRQGQGAARRRPASPDGFTVTMDTRNT